MEMGHQSASGIDSFSAAMALFKNLWRTNNLEQYRAPSASGAIRTDGVGAKTKDQDGGLLGQPKVIITCRSELLSSNTKYVDSFLLIESQNIDKDDTHEALMYFQEVRLVDFTSKRQAFQTQAAALRWRDKFIASFPRLHAEPPRRPAILPRELVSNIGFPESTIDQVEQVIIVANLPHSAELEGEAQLSDFAPCVAAWLAQFTGPNSLPTEQQSIVAVLAALCQLKPEEDLSEVKAFLREQSSENLDEAMWTSTDYLQDFTAISELEELTNTPFMVEIVTAILQRLKLQGRASSEIKSQLVITLGEELAERAWALLRQERVVENIRELEAALDEGAGEKRERWVSRIHKVAQDMVTELASVASKTRDDDEGDARGMHRGQRALVKMKSVSAFDQGKETEINNDQWQVIQREMLAALQRPTTLRATIYSIFVDMWVNREAEKAAGQLQGMSSMAIRIEAREYAL